MNRNLGLQSAVQKMQNAGASAAAVGVFSHYYRQLQSGETGLIRESDIEPYVDVPHLADVEVAAGDQRHAIARTAIIKLNGGLGTSMGLDRAKTLLPVRDGLNFLDIIARQVLSVRREYDVDLPLVFMTSFRTDRDTREYLSRYDLKQSVPLTFLQNQEPKLRADDLTPVSWPDDPSLEWCPPGHGDIYVALQSSGILDQLLDAGFWYACVSNGDNLGAAPSPLLAGWFARSGAPYAAELCRRTINDRKGGHLAVRRSDGQLVLRDAAQTHPDDMRFFLDENLHPFFNTNTLWFDLRRLRELLTERESVLGLPLIRNEKPVDPTRPESTRVIQVETAMGAAIEAFPGSTAISVGRDRFLPVKTTNELLLLRSDVYELNDAWLLETNVADVPEVRLTGDYYQTVEQMDARIPVAPSLRDASKLIVEGDWKFEPGVRITGELVLGPEGGTVSP